MLPITPESRTLRTLQSTMLRACTTTDMRLRADENSSTSSTSNLGCLPLKVSRNVTVECCLFTNSMPKCAAAETSASLRDWSAFARRPPDGKFWEFDASDKSLLD